MASHPTPLLTTPLRIGVALGLTAFGIALTVLHWDHARSGWLLTAGSVRHGWLPTVLNLFFYGYCCWLGFWFIRGTKGRERVFMGGWFAGILLSPLAALGLQWSAAIRYIGLFGLAVALLVSLSLLLKARTWSDHSSGTDTT